MEAASINRTEFPAIPAAEWLEIAGAAAPARDRQPYHRRASVAPAFRQPLGALPFLQRIDAADPSEANAKARKALDEGAGGLALVFAGAGNSYGSGLPAEAEALTAALDGLPLTRMRLRLDPHPASRQSVDWLVAILAGRKVDASRLDLAFGLDPASIFAASGRLNMSLEAMQASLPQSIGHFFALNVPALLLEADGRVVHNAGASPARELGVALAAAVSHLRMFEMARQPLVYAAPHIGFTLAFDADPYLSALKIAALRLVWRRAQEVCRIEPSRAAVHAASSYRLLTEADDSAVSLALLGAAMGGADTIAPHRALGDAQIAALAGSLGGIASRPSTRLAVDVDDLAALASEAWDEFIAIEAEDGILYSLAAGGIQARVRSDLHLFQTGEPAEAAETGTPAPVAEGTFACDPLLPSGLNG